MLRTRKNHFVIRKVLIPAVVVTAACVWAFAQPAPPAGAGKLVFKETFDRDLANWAVEGAHTVEVKAGRLHVKTVSDGKNLGQFVWCRTEPPKDFRVEFDLTPVSDSGFFLLFFCVQGVQGEDILGPDLFDNYLPWRTWKDYQDWDKYTSPPRRQHDSRIRGYHTSYRRNEIANCNLRKNPGLKLVKSNDLKTLLPKEKTAHVVLTKFGQQIHLEVNGQVFMDWSDPDVTFWSGGRFGFRQVYDSEGYYDNVRFFDLTGTGKGG